MGAFIHSTAGPLPPFRRGVVAVSDEGHEQLRPGVAHAGPRRTGLPEGARAGTGAPGSAQGGALRGEPSVRQAPPAAGKRYCSQLLLILDCRWRPWYRN